MADIVWHSGDAYLTAFGRCIACSCKVRNEINGLRLPHEVVRTEPHDIPYYPREFPVGTWNVYAPHSKSDQYMAPYFIPTDAWQMVDTWSVVQEDGARYGEPTGKQDRDEGYGLHHSVSKTTLGCIKIEYEDDLVWLVLQINAVLGGGNKVTLEVS
jgi:hypothetical protein